MSPTISRVREYMTSSVVSVVDDTPLEKVVKTLGARNVSCVLVTTSDNSPVGVVSLTDLARVSRVERTHHGPLELMPPDRRAKDIMRSPVLTVADDATIGEAASKMLHNRVHRLFVSSGGRIAGVFSTRDALRVAFFRRIDTPVSSVMTTPVDTVLLGDSIDDAIAKLDETNRRGIVVVDGTYPIGIFTQLEAIRARALSPALRRNPVEEVMSYESITIDASTPLYRAAAQAIATRVRRMLVVEDRRLVGIVSGYDLARVVA